EVYQVSGDVPIRSMIQEPVTGDVIPVAPIGRARHDAGAVSIQDGNASLPHLVEEPSRGKRGHVENLAQRLVYYWPYELPEGKHCQQMGLPVIIATAKRKPVWRCRKIRAGEGTRGRYRVWSGHKGWHAQLLSNRARNGETDR